MQTFQMNSLTRLHGVNTLNKQLLKEDITILKNHITMYACNMVYFHPKNNLPFKIINTVWRVSSYLKSVNPFKREKLYYMYLYPSNYELGL